MWFDRCFHITAMSTIFCAVQRLTQGRLGSYQDSGCYMSVQFHALEKKAKSEGKGMFWAAYVLPKEFSLVLWFFSPYFSFELLKTGFIMMFLLFLRQSLPTKCLHKSFCRFFSVPFWHVSTMTFKMRILSNICTNWNHTANNYFQDNWSYYFWL